MILKPYVLEKTAIEIALNANECERWIDPFIANLGHPLWGSQSMPELAPVFCLSSLEMLSPALTASPIKDDPDLQWMGLFIAHTHLHLVQSLWLSFLTHKVSRHLCLQNYTHKIVHSSAMHYQNLIIIHECSKKLLEI